MKKKFLLGIAYAVAILTAACTGGSVASEETGAAKNEEYVQSINQWHREREAKLKAPDGWLTLAGLFWLEEGENTFGSGTDNALVFPAGKIAEQAGSLILKEGSVTLRVAEGVRIELGDEPIQEAVLYSPEMESVPELKYGSLTWFVIRRGDSYGIRLRDQENPALAAFTGIERYPVAQQWRVEARLQQHPMPKQIAITNIVGHTTPEDSPGTLVFTVDGQEYRLDALDGGEGKLFMIFADKTNGLETYGAGRYVYVDEPDAEGKTFIDFNKATNPPCAFVPYATCPLPPRQNFLPIGIPAGEKSYGDH